MANFDIRQNSNIRYRRIASILPEYQLFHQNTQFPTRIHNSLPEYQNKLPEYQDKINSFTILRISVLHFASDTSKWSQLSDVDLVPIFEALVTAVNMFYNLSAFCSTLWCLFCSPWCTMHSSLKLMPYHLPYQVRHQFQKHHENSWSLTTLTIFLLLVFHLKETFKFKLLNSNN